MIYLSFNHSHLLCTVWSHVDEKPILTQLSQIPLTGNLDRARENETLYKNIFEQGLKSLTNEVSLDGHEVFVTIPDHWVHHDFTEVDSGSKKDDSWDLILWQKSQRFGSSSIDYSTFAEPIQDNIIHVLHVPHIFIFTVKLSLNEYGATPIWLGTESMTFTGSTTKTFGVCSDNGSGYDLFIVKRKTLLASSVRFVKGAFNVANSFGFKDEITDLLNVSPKSSKRKLKTIYFVDELSDTRQAHWGGFKLTFFKPFNTALNESSESFDNYSYHLLAIQTMLDDDTFTRSEINFFANEGITYSLTDDIEKIILEDKPEKEKNSETKFAKISKVKPKIKKSIDLQKVIVYLTTTMIILAFIMALYLNNANQITFPFVDSKPVIEETIVETVVDESKKESKYPNQLVDIMNHSNSMIYALDFIYSTFEHKNVSFLSVSSLDLQLEIVNGEEVDIDFTELGTIINYFVDGFDCCGGYKHFYDFRLPLVNDEETDAIGTTNTFQAAVSNLNGLIEKLDPIDKGSFIQTPFIIKVNGEQNRNTFFESLKRQGENILLRKAIVKTDPESGNSQSVFYISVFERKSM